MIRTFLFFSLFLSCVPGHKVEDILVSPNNLEPRFLNGVPIKEVSVTLTDDTYYLYRHGEDKNGNCMHSRTELVDDSNGALFLRLSGTTETCKGVGCSHCGFKTGGGCVCENSLNTCEHIITRNRDILRLR